MTMSPDSRVDCRMRITVVETTVERVARALFNVLVEVDQELQARQVVTNGTWLTPSSQLCLTKARDEAVAQLLGASVFEAMKANRCYQEDQQRAMIPTRCVSVSLNRDPRPGADIDLELGLKEAFQIAHHLYSI